MYHPLLSNPEAIKDAELEAKILDLSKKYQIASRMGQGGVCEQIISALDMYKMELTKRQQQSMQSMVKRQNKDLDDLINVD